MRPETLKKEISKVEWHKPGESLPLSQGMLINEVIKRYNIRGIISVGYYLDLCAVKTRKQILAWKDNGVGARFLGIIEEDGSVSQQADEPPNKTIKLIRDKCPYNTMKELWDEINKRDYDNIIGLKSHITEEVYFEMLDVLPPMKMGPGWFILSEALTDGLYMKYSNNPLMAEVIKLEDEEIMTIERGENYE